MGRSALSHHHIVMHTNERTKITRMADAVKVNEA
jgi:hypothetical protein